MDLANPGASVVALRNKDNQLEYADETAVDYCGSKRRRATEAVCFYRKPMDTGRFAYFSPAGDLNHMRTGPEVLQVNVARTSARDVI
jgi:hypothetical protein